MEVVVKKRRLVVAQTQAPNLGRRYKYNSLSSMSNVVHGH